MRESGRYLLVGREDAARPDPVQAAWLYAQMARWGQTELSKDALRTAMGAFRPDLYDVALGKASKPKPRGSFAAFAGPAFDPDDITGYLASFDVAKRA